MSAAGEVLLLTARPAMHRALIEGLARKGARVRVPRRPGEAARRLARGPALVLVDLVHGAGLSAELVERLNHPRGRCLVLALHDGSLDGCEREAEGLCVQGFCAAHDCLPVAQALVAPPGAAGVWLH